MRLYVDVGTKRVSRIHVAEAAADHVTLSWQSPAVDVELYEVIYWKEDLYRNISVAFSFYTNVTVSRLRPQSVYMFRVSHNI